jgi:hypothetical protein
MQLPPGINLSIRLRATAHIMSFDSVSLELMTRHWLPWFVL